MKQTRLAFESLEGQIMKCGPSAHRLFHEAKHFCCQWHSTCVYILYAPVFTHNKFRLNCVSKLNI